MKNKDVAPKKGVWIRIDHTPEYAAVVRKLASAEANMEEVKKTNEKLRGEIRLISDELRKAKEGTTDAFTGPDAR